MSNNRLVLRGSWVSVVDRFNGTRIASIYHESALISEVTPETRIAAFIGRVLSLDVGKSVTNGSLVVERRTEKLFEFTEKNFGASDISFAFDIKDVIDLLVQCAIRMGS